MGNHRGTMRAAAWLALGVSLCACDSSAKKKKEPRCEADASCEAAVDGGRRDDAGEVDAGTKSGLKGRVFDAEGASALAGASLTLAGETASSDKSGAFALATPAKASVLELTSAGYVPAKQAAPRAGYVEVFLKKVDERVEFRGDEGVKVRLPSGAGIDIPAGAVEDKKGERIDGTVTLELAEIDGRVRTQAAALPGNGRARLRG